MTILTFDDITVGLLPIADTSGSRRDRERAAVAEIVADIAGKGATIGHTGAGAPFLPGGPFVSVSHSRHLAAVAFSPNSPVGIDIEEDRKGQLLRVAPRVLDDGEMSAYFPNRLLEAWTKKEAAFKAAGGGTADLRDIKLCANGTIAFGKMTLEVVFSDKIDTPCPAFFTLVKPI